MIPEATKLFIENGQASISLLQRRFRVGYTRAARIVDQMEQRGLVGPYEGSKPRQIKVTMSNTWTWLKTVNYNRKQHNTP